MIYNVPSKIERESFKTNILSKLNNPKRNSYKKIFNDNYKCPQDSTEYTLKENLSDELLAELDFVLKRIGYNQFDTIKNIAEYFRILLNEKKYIVLFAYNGTGKTRLSTEFKSLGQQLNGDTEEKTADTLYYNAFTEDLFHWNNDLDNDTYRYLEMNSSSRFFNGLRELEMENRIRPFLSRYADFDFDIIYEDKRIFFSREIKNDGIPEKIEYIKISRGEENIFIWCFFLAIVQLVIDKDPSYDWVQYIYIDDPVSSLDDNNAISVASHLAHLIRGNDIKLIVSSHHTLFFNVLCNEINKSEQLFLRKNTKSDTYTLKDTTKTPFFHHVALLKELKKAADSGELYTYHFNILRNILEKTASFHGFPHFSSCIKQNTNDSDGIVHKRILDLLSHGNYSLFDPIEMVEENKEHFKNILNNFLGDYKFNEKLFEDSQLQGAVNE